MKLTDDARAVAAFTIAAALITGAWQQVTLVVAGLFDSLNSQRAPLVLGLVVTLGVAVFTALMARSAAEAVNPGWTKVLGQAGVFVAGIVSCLVLVALIATLVNSNGGLRALT